MVASLIGTIEMGICCQIPDAFGPAVVLFGSDLFGKIHTFQAGERFGQFQSARFASGHISANHNGTILRTFFTEDTSQTTCINISNGNNAVFFQIFIKGKSVAPIAG